MILLDLLVLIGLLGVCSVGPGFYFVRRLRWGPQESWCAAIGLSLVLLYGASFLIYALDLPRGCYFAVSAVGLLLTLASGADLLRLMKNRALRRRMILFGWLFVWGMLLLSLVRHYSGGAWAGDWWEHFQRTGFFIRATHMPKDFRFLGQYLLPARPPLLNLVAAFFLSQVGVDFVPYQVIFLFLNLLIFFPLCLVVPAFGRGGRLCLSVFALLLLANPLLWQNVTWPWTKLLTGFYVLLGLWLYIVAWRKADSGRMAAAFLSLAAACLVHYSAGPYVLFLAAHYLVAVFPRRARRWREAFAIALPAAALLATWLSWSMAHYGFRGTFASNTTVTGLELQEGEPAWWTEGKNIVFSFVPHPFHVSRSEFGKLMEQSSRLGYLRDYLFLIYQTNYVFALGCVGGPLVVYLLVRAWHGPGSGRPGWRFWSLFVMFCAIVGVLVHSIPDRYGLAHICGQPLILMGVAYLAASYRTLPPLLRWAGLVGAAIDVCLGVLLHFNLENRIFPMAQEPSGQRIFLATGDDLSMHARENFALKLNALRRPDPYWGDHFVPLAGIIQAVLVVGFFIVLVRTIRVLLTWQQEARQAKKVPVLYEWQAKSPEPGIGERLA